MTEMCMLFLGRTGVGKSSLVNFLAGEASCDIDPYRACTKEPKVVSVKCGVSEYDLIDTPGLCEGGSELDSLYLDLIDRYLLDVRVSPILVFKGDDSRLRTEDYQLIHTLLLRYGNRIFEGGLMLTFAGNLIGDYHSKVQRRVKLITTAIYGIQVSLGMEIFSGFSSITLVDSELQSFFDLHSPHNGIQSPDLHLAFDIREYEDMAAKLGVHPEMCDSILSKIVADGSTDLNFDRVLGILNRFPFHNLMDQQSPPTQPVSTAISTMNDDPKSVYELAARLNTDGFDDSSITIESGLLTYTATLPFRKRVNSERFADCISISAYSSREDQGSLKYFVHYKIIAHAYQENGTPDIPSILQLSQSSASAIVFAVETYAKFRRLIEHPSYLATLGITAFHSSVEEALSDESIWEQ